MGAKYRKKAYSDFKASRGVHSLISGKYINA